MMSHDVTVHVTSMSLHTHSNAWRFRVPDRMHYWDVYCTTRLKFLHRKIYQDSPTTCRSPMLKTDSQTDQPGSSQQFDYLLQFANIMTVAKIKKKLRQGFTHRVAQHSERSTLKPPIHYWTLNVGH